MFVPAGIAQLQRRHSGGGTSSLLTGLKAWWEMDEASGTRFDSHNSNDLVSGGGGGAPGSVSGLDKLACNFVAASTNILNAPGTNWTTDNASYSMAFWIYFPGAFPRNDNIFYSGTAATRSMQLGTSSSSDRLYISVYNTSSSGTTVYGPYITYNTWYCAYFGYDFTNNDIVISWDGGTITTTAFSGTHKSAAGHAFRMSYNTFAPGLPLNGYVNRAAFWTRILTQSECSEWYNSGVPVRYSAL